MAPKSKMPILELPSESQPSLARVMHRYPLSGIMIKFFLGSVVGCHRGFPGLVSPLSWSTAIQWWNVPFITLHWGIRHHKGLCSHCASSPCQYCAGFPLLIPSMGNIAKPSYVSRPEVTYSSVMGPWWHILRGQLCPVTKLSAVHPHYWHIFPKTIKT